MEERPVTVTCYAGYKGDERPVSFSLEGETFLVSEILDRWYDPDANLFKVEVAGGAIRLLRQDLDTGNWTLLR